MKEYRLIDGFIINMSEVTVIEWGCYSATLDPFMTNNLMKEYIFIDGSNIK